jgi:hypothetical protein
MPQLSPQQLRILQVQLAHRLGYLSRLIRRMDARGFTPNDKLYQLATAAYQAVHQLHLEVHTQAVGRGMGR